MATELVDIQLDETSLVKRGANKFANILLHKSDPGGPVTRDDILKALAGLTDAERAEVAKAATPAPADPLAGIPADIRKRLDDIEAENTKLRKAEADRAEAETIAKAESEYVAKGMLPGVGVLIAKAEKAGFGAELRAYVAKVAGPLAKAARELGQLHGSAGESESSNPAEALMAKAREIAKTASIPVAKAYQLACDANPDLARAAHNGSN